MKRFIAIFLLAACATAGAEVFRQVGPDGEVSFSDTPAPGAERVNVDPAQTVTLPPVPQRGAGMGKSNGKANKKQVPAKFAIVEPTNGQSIRANDGKVTVSLSLQPALMPGYTIDLVVSGGGGENVYSGVTLNFHLSDLSRGEHTLVARLKNGRGEQVVEAGPVTFYVLRVAAGG